eukprot:749771-Pleurochrysis_carterae.AAC.2
MGAGGKQKETDSRPTGNGRTRHGRRDQQTVLYSGAGTAARRVHMNETRQGSMRPRTLKTASCSLVHQKRAGKQSC